MDRKEFDGRLAKNPIALATLLYKQNTTMTAVIQGMRKRLDPQLSESAILGNLSVPASAENSEMLQVGVLLSLVATYDRRLERTTFLELATAATALYGMLGRLSIAEAVLHLVEKNAFTKDKIEDAAKELTSYAEAERHKMLKVMELVKQCPTSEDKIH